MADRRRERVPAARILLLASCISVIGGCGGEQSALDPQSKPARDIATLWWWMLAIATAVFLGAVGLLVLAWLRRSREGAPIVGEREGFNLGMVVAFGMG